MPVNSTVLQFLYVSTRWHCCCTGGWSSATRSICLNKPPKTNTRANFFFPFFFSIFFSFFFSIFFFLKSEQTALTTSSSLVDKAETCCSVLLVYINLGRCAHYWCLLKYHCNFTEESNEQRCALSLKTIKQSTQHVTLTNKGRIM